MPGRWELRTETAMRDDSERPSSTYSRRRTLQLSGLVAVGSTAALAGCGEGPGQDEADDPEETGSEPEEEPAQPEGDDPEDDPTEENVSNDPEGAADDEEVPGGENGEDNESEENESDENESADNESEENETNSF